MRPLINDMVQDDPTKRRNMSEVVERFEELVQSLSQGILRSRAASRMLYFAQRIQTPLYLLSHWKRKITYIINRTPAIPMAPVTGT